MTKIEKRKKGTIVSKIEIKLQFPYVVPTQYEHRRAADTHIENMSTSEKYLSNVSRQTNKNVTMFFNLILTHSLGFMENIN